MISSSSSTGSRSGCSLSTAPPRPAGATCSGGSSKSRGLRGASPKSRLLWASPKSRFSRWFVDKKSPLPRPPFPPPLSPFSSLPALASLTVTRRPPISATCNLPTCSASSSVRNVTKPKPLGFPVSLSITTLTPSTSPCSSKNSLIASSSRCAIPPTKICRGSLPLSFPLPFPSPLLLPLPLPLSNPSPKLKSMPPLKKLMSSKLD
mmetsp:Transcript_52840/g.83918  ORF Transcript_52840/g.83918 Transcript_52840/m.83918 type:complete len:206 (-) Transcript_52840:505-1122(-)